MTLKKGIALAAGVAVLVWGQAGGASAATIYVAPGGTGQGTSAAPFGRIQDGINAAQPGDVVSVAAGTYSGAFRSVRAGSASARITVRAAGDRGSVVVNTVGRVATISHAYFTIEGLVLDGGYGADDAVVVQSAATGFILRNSEVRRTSMDGLDIGSTSDVLIEGSLIHHTLNATGGRTDAHGIGAGAVRRLTIRNTEIHSFSGDAVQLDPDRAAPGWNDVVIEGCRLWLGPLPSAANGFSAGTVPGENAVDTKAASDLPRARITIRNTEAWGFQRGLIRNMAAFNLKENIDALVDGVTVRGSEIGFRMRGPSSAQPAGAWVRVQNAVVHTTVTAFRYEDNIQNLRIWNTTVGGGVTWAIQDAKAAASALDIRNFLVLGSALPLQADRNSSLAVGSASFVDAARHNYQLAAGSPAIDAGATIPGVTRDRQNTPRPQGSAYDIGAFERVTGSTSGGGSDIVLHSATAQTIAGNWAAVPEPTAASGALLMNEDLGAARLSSALAAPVDYFELSFRADAGRPYRIWLRGRAAEDARTNDAVFVQFSDSLNAKGGKAYRIGTTSALKINLAECGTCGLSGWGWQDATPLVYFAKSGVQTIRVQPREDGLSIDQIVVSDAAYLTASPGLPTDDTTILEATAP